MIVALMIGRAGSRGLPGKNIKTILGKSLCEFPLIACKKSKFVQKIFVSTDCPDITTIARNQSAELIERPPELASKEALGEDAFAHGYYEIKKRLDKEDLDIELVVLLFANGATLTKDLIDKGVAILRKNEGFDSAVTTSVYNMWSPLRARKLQEDGCLHPMVPFETFGDPSTLNCDRDSQGDVHFADMSVSVVRPRCLENLADGLSPQKWMGQRIASIPNWGGCDVDYEWQIPMVEFWLRKHGVQEAKR